MKVTQEFLEIIGNWSNIQDLEDIPRRLKKLKKLELNDDEQSIVTFMKDVQQTREFVRRKPMEEVDDNNE